MFAQADPWRWQPHPEVWVLLLGVLGLALFVTRRIGPNALPEGERPVSRRQAVWFWLGFAGLWIASDWPMHDIAEEYLYSVHMVQHLLLTFVVPPLLLMATPTWLAELILGNGVVHKWMKRLTHPVVAGVAFNAVQIITHWQLVVNTSVDSGPFHYGVHTLVFTTSLLMWMPVLGPAPEFHISKPAQMIYLFFMTLVPTVPAAWLTFAEGVLYENYDNAYRLFGITATHDQQYAGVVMKIVAGTYLWVLITTMFFRWASKLQSDDQQSRRNRFSGDWDAAAIEEIGTEDTPVG